MSETDEQEQPRKCFVCGKPRLEPEQRQTCTPCASRTRQALIEIEQLYALLPGSVAASSAGSVVAMSSHSAESPVPGGDALVMLAPGSDGSAAALASLYGLDDSHAGDDYPSDPPAVLAELGSWEDAWRELRHGAGHNETPAARPATLMQTVTWLTRRLMWAEQEHDAAYDEFAKDVRRVLGRLRSVTRSGNRYEYGVIDCPACGDELYHDVYDPKLCEHPGKPHCDHGHADPAKWACRGSNTCGCDQGGRRDFWRCRNRGCPRTMEPWEYWLAVRDLYERRDLETS